MSRKTVSAELDGRDMDVSPHCELRDKSADILRLFVSPTKALGGAADTSADGFWGTLKVS